MADNTFSMKQLVSDARSKELDIDTLKVRGKTLIFGNSIFYIPNISRIDVHDLSIEKSLPWYFWLLLITSFLLYFVFEQALLSVVSMALMGLILYNYLKDRQFHNRYGLGITLNSGSSTTMISPYLDFVKEVALVLYNIMNSEEDKSINFHFDERKIVEIGGDVSGSTVVSGHVAGDIVNSI